MSFSGAQAFFIDPAAIAGAESGYLSRISVWFKAKPQAIGNKSGIEEPGVTLILTSTANGVPILDNIELAPSVRLEYQDVSVSADATLPTHFRFANLVPVDTNKTYAYLLKYDGDEDFVTWKSVVGDRLVGSNTVSSGPSGKYTGNYFTYISPVPISANTANQVALSNSGIVWAGANSVTNNSPANAVYIQSSWRPMSDVDEKFQVAVARFRINGSSNLESANGTQVPGTVNVVTNAQTGVITFRVPAQRYEFISYDRRVSRKGVATAGERVWQHTRYLPHNGNAYTIAVSNGSATITNTSSFSFNDVFSGGVDDEYMIITSEDHHGVGNPRVFVRKIASIDSNTQITLDEPCPITNAAAKFFKSPVAVISRIETTRAFGKDDDILILTDSNANQSIRFVNNCIVSVNVTSNGTGYNNTDYITWSGFENVTSKVIGGYVAVANLVTNSTGGVVNVFITNCGAGFVNTAAMSMAVTNSTAGATGGSGLAITANVGMEIRAEESWNGNTGFFANCTIVNLEVGDVIATDVAQNPSGTFYSQYHRLPYYVETDATVLGGKAYYVDAVEANTDVYWVTPGMPSGHKYKKKRVYPSWSKELVTVYSDGTPSNGYGVPTDQVLGPAGDLSSNASVVVVNAVANGDFTNIQVDSGLFTFWKYIINNDYTDEHTNQGNAWAKGIHSKIYFREDHYAEDLIVYLTAYRPVNTDIKVYSRVHNSADDEAFDDKDWSLLELSSGNNLYSSATNPSDYVELTYGFPTYPNTQFVSNGTLTTELANASVVGFGTTFTSNLAVNDLVRIYQPLFPNNMHIGVVNSITNNTLLTLKSPISNAGLVGTGLKLAKVQYPQQAFRYVLNDNVARYYSSSMVEYDTFNTFQLKIVLTATDDRLVPRVDDVRATGVSA